MKKICYLLIFSLLLFLDIVNVKAVTECSSTEMARLNQLANNIKINNKNKIDIVNEETKSIYTLYDIDIINFDKDLKIQYGYSDTSKDELIELTSKEPKIEDLVEGRTLVLYIYSYTANLCTEKLLKTIKIKLPVYNDYYYFNKEKLQDNPDFKYSKEFIDEDKNYDEIEEEFEKYLKKEENSDLLNSKFNINLYLILGGIIGIIILLCVIIVIQKRKKKEEDYL